MSKVALSLALVFAPVFALHASTAQAQPPGGVVTRSVVTNADRGYVEVNLGLQATSTAFDITTHPVTFVEPSTVQANYSVKGAREFDVGGGVRVARQLAVGASFSKFERAGNVAVDARLPHPFFFNHARTVTGTANDLARRETALHGRVSWTGVMGGGWELWVSGGPSFFKVEQDLVENITVTETYPYDTATFASAVSQRHSSSGLGFNVGADVTKLFTPHMGVGASVVFSRATLKFDTFSDPTRSFDVGGARVGGGLRFRF
jgi:hypothetical protein